MRWGTSCTKYVGEPSSRDEISPSKDSDADAGAAENVGAPEKSGQLVREKAHQRAMKPICYTRSPRSEIGRLRILEWMLRILIERSESFVGYIVDVGEETVN